MLYFVTRRILEIKFWWKKKVEFQSFFFTGVKWVKFTQITFQNLSIISKKFLSPTFYDQTGNLNSSVVRGLQVPNSSSRIQFIKSRHRSLTNLHTRVSTYTCHYLPRYNDKIFNTCVPFQRFWFGVSSSRCIKSFLWSWKWILW